MGYLMNLLAVPLLAFAQRWEVVAALLIAERFGKALRTPGRDAIVSYAAGRVGAGFGFGIHEAMDRIGGLLGPLLMVVLGILGIGSRVSFLVLGIPALLSLLMLATAQNRFPRPQEFEPMQPNVSGGFPIHFWIYMGAISCISLGFINYPLLSYFFLSHLPVYAIPLLYALAVFVSACATLLLGKLFDRWGVKVILFSTLLSMLFVPFVFSQSVGAPIVGMVLWGIGWGSQGSILRAAVARWISKERRATAYGILNFSFGLFSFFGGSLIGFLLDRSLFYTIFFSLVAQFMALPLLCLVERYEHRTH
jgi:predicted MFS family arabinose efflux permease